MPRSAPEELPVPEFYRTENASRWEFAPDAGALAARAGAWRCEHALAPAAADDFRLHLLLVDLQRDFCLPAGSLYVGGRSGRGALEDVDRVARFVYRNLHRITEISVTLDTHVPFQIFFTSRLRYVFFAISQSRLQRRTRGATALESLDERPGASLRARLVLAASRAIDLPQGGSPAASRLESALT